MVDPALRAALREATGVLFLCSGNMVRSAFADLYARHLGCALPVASAATHFRNGHLLRETAHALRERGVAPQAIAAFRPRHIADVIGDLDRRTVALGMSRFHLDALGERAELRERAFLLPRVLGRDEEIPDPVLEGADYGRTFELLTRCIEALVALLSEEARHRRG